MVAELRVEAQHLWAAVEKDTSTPVFAGPPLSEFHEGATDAVAASRRFDHEVVDVQVLSAGQAGDDAHANDAKQVGSSKSPEHQVAQGFLARHATTKLIEVELVPQLNHQAERRS